MYQSRNTVVGPLLNGWALRQLHPWWLYSDPEGRQDLFEELKNMSATLRADITTALVAEFTRITSSFSDSSWERLASNASAVDHWFQLQPLTHVPNGAPYSKVKLFAFTENLHADNFY